MSDNIFGFQFYPTSAELVDKMMDMIDWSKVTSLLEPSAGKVEYEKVFADPSKYIGNGQLLQLVGG